MSLSRQGSNLSQRHLTVSAIRERMGWEGQNTRGYWQDLRDSAQEFRLRHFRDSRWGDLDDDLKERLCAAFTRNSHHRALIEREETRAGQRFISWWLLANTRPTSSRERASAQTTEAGPSRPPGSARSQPPTTASGSSSSGPRPYYDPVRGSREGSDDSDDTVRS